MFPFLIDVYSSIENLTPSKRDVETTANNTVSDLAYSFYLELKTKAAKFKNHSQISFKNDKRGVSTVTIQEDFKSKGFEAFDLKPGLLRSSKAKIGKDGKRYLVVPISKNKPAQAEIAVPSQSMTYQPVQASRAPSLQLGKVQVTASEIARPLVSIRPDSVSVNIRPSIVDNDQPTLEKTQGSAEVTLRVVSQNSDPRSWIHPGVKPSPLNPEVLYTNFKPPESLSQLIDRRFKALFD